MNENTKFWNGCCCLASVVGHKTKQRLLGKTIEGEEKLAAIYCILLINKCGLLGQPRDTNQGKR
jgi:hypothetical protein